MGIDTWPKGVKFQLGRRDIRDLAADLAGCRN